MVSVVTKRNVGRGGQQKHALLTLNTSKEELLYVLQKPLHKSSAVKMHGSVHYQLLLETFLEGGRHEIMHRHALTRSPANYWALFGQAFAIQPLY